MKNPYIKSIVIFVATLTILLLPIKPLVEMRTAVFCSFGNLYATLFVNGGDDGKILEFEKASYTDKSSIVWIKFGNLNHTFPNGQVLGQQLETNINSTYWTPFAFLVALILASPVPLKRRFWALLTGTLILLVFYWFRLIMFLTVCPDERLRLADVSGFFYDVMLVLNNIFIEGMAAGSTVALVVIIWLIATFRKSDYQAAKELILGERNTETVK